MPNMAVFPLQGDDGPDVRGGSGDILLVHATETDRKGMRGSRAQPGTAWHSLCSAPWPQTAGLGDNLQASLSLGGCVYLWEMEVSWISPWWFHLAAGMGLTPHSPSWVWRMRHTSAVSLYLLSCLL